MARFHLEAGASIETVTPAELQSYMDGRAKAERQRLLGIKFRRLPPMNGQVAGGAIQIGGDYAQSNSNAVGTQVGPSSGHLWAIRLIAVAGLTAGNPTDLLNMQILGAADPDFNWWQWSGNNFSYTFGKNELFLNPGEYLQFTSQGAITAPNGTRIRIRGMIQSVPAELAGELI